MQESDHRAAMATKSTSTERRRSVATPVLSQRSGSSRRLSTEPLPSHAVAQMAAAALAQRRQSLVPRPSMLSASLASLASADFAETDGDDDNARDSTSTSGENSASASRGDAMSSVALQLAADGGEDTDDVAESDDGLSPLELQVQMLRGKLARRNVIIEVIRRAYYHDVIVVKEELRHAKLSSPTREGSSSGGLALQSTDERLSAVPSVDLRDALQLFAPAETVLQVHPCASCGGHLELVHGEVRACVGRGGRSGITS